MCICLSMYVYRSQTNVVRFLPLFHLLLSLELTNLANLTGQQAPGILLSLPSQYWPCRDMLSCPPSYMDAVNLNSVPHARTASTL